MSGQRMAAIGGDGVGQLDLAYAMMLASIFRPEAFASPSPDAVAQAGVITPATIRAGLDGLWEAAS